MKINQKIRFIAGAAIATITSVTLCQVAQAGTFHNGWYYVEDSFNDSTSGNDVGGTEYELYRWAFQQADSVIRMAIETNTPLSGVSNPDAEDGHVGFSDMLFNFSGKDLNTASNDGELYGIRFDVWNDSGVSTTGVFSNVVAKSVAKENGSGVNSSAEYNSWVSSQGKTPSMGDLAANDPYFDQSQHVQSVIASGTKVAEVNLVEGEMLSNFGLDLSQFGTHGSHILGLTFDSGSLPVGNFLAHFGLECNNDLMAMLHKTEIVPDPKDVPEPSSILGLLTLVGFGGFLKLTNKTKKLSS